MQRCRVAPGDTSAVAHRARHGRRARCLSRCLRCDPPKMAGKPQVVSAASNFASVLQLSSAAVATVAVTMAQLDVWTPLAALKVGDVDPGYYRKRMSSNHPPRRFATVPSSDSQMCDT